LYDDVVPDRSPTVAAILLTGGKSRRMGHDKSRLIVEGSTLAVRTARLLRPVVETAVEVGPGVSGLPTTLEEPPGGGPLAALSAGYRALRLKSVFGAHQLHAVIIFVAHRVGLVLGARSARLVTTYSSH